MSAKAVMFVLAQKIKPAALKFYMTRVAYRIDEDRGYAWPSQKLIAEEMSVSLKTVKQYQTECEMRGILRAAQFREAGKFDRNHYEIPGFMDWLAHSDASAREFFEAAVKSPEHLRGATDRSTSGVSLKEGSKRGKRKKGREEGSYYRGRANGKAQAHGKAQGDHTVKTAERSNGFANAGWHSHSAKTASGRVH